MTSLPSLNLLLVFSADTTFLTSLKKNVETSVGTAEEHKNIYSLLLGILLEKSPSKNKKSKYEFFHEKNKIL